MNTILYYSPAMSVLNKLLMDKPVMPATRRITRTSNSTVPVNIHEDEHVYTLAFFAPGFSKDEFSVQNNDGVLTVKGIRKEKEQTVEYTRHEFGVHDFERAFKLPEKINAEGIVARYDQGILYLELPKSNVNEVIREIQIQ